MVLTFAFIRVTSEVITELNEAWREEKHAKETPSQIQPGDVVVLW